MLIPSLLLAATALVVTLPAVAALDNTTTDVPNFLQDPPCAADCALSGLASTRCPSSNQTCLCEDDAWFLQSLQPCLLVHCSAEDALIAINVTSTLCARPPKNHYQKLNVVIGVMAAFPTFAVIVRLSLKFANLSCWYHDDTTIVLAWIFFAALLPGGIAIIRWGLVQDMWSISARTITRFLIIFFIFEPFYFIMIALVKASILFTYMRIFNGIEARRIFWATQMFNLGQTLVFVVLCFAQCRPLDHFWLGWTGEHVGTCFHMNDIPVAHAAVGVLLDIWLVALPANLVWRLEMRGREKVAVTLMFGCGIFLIVVSCIRIPTLLAFYHPTALTESSIDSAIWSCVEICVGICVACMHNLRQFTNVVVIPWVRRLLHLPPKPLPGTRASTRARESLPPAGKSNPSTACRDSHPPSAAADLQPGEVPALGPLPKVEPASRDSTWSGGSAGDRRSRVTFINVEDVVELRHMSGVMVGADHSRGAVTRRMDFDSEGYDNLSRQLNEVDIAWVSEAGGGYEGIARGQPITGIAL